MINYKKAEPMTIKKAEPLTNYKKAELMTKKKQKP